MACSTSCCGASASAYEARKRARACSTSTTSSSAAGAARRQRDVRGAVVGALRAADGRRAPGHEPAPARVLRALEPRQPVHGRRRVPVDLRLPPRRRAPVPRAPRGARARRRGARADAQLPLAAAMLAAVNAVFAQRFGSGFRRSSAARTTRGEPRPARLRRRAAAHRPATAGSSTRRRAAIAAGLPPAPLWRRAEARLLAQRHRELIGAGTARPGTSCVLLRATGDIETFERALQLSGLRRSRRVGGFWSRQQIERSARATCARSPTRATRRRSTASSPRRWRPARATGSRCWRCAAREAGSRVGDGAGLAGDGRRSSASADRAGSRGLRLVRGSSGRGPRGAASPSCSSARSRRAATGARAGARLARAPAGQRAQAAAAGPRASRRSEGRDLRAFVDHVARAQTAAARRARRAGRGRRAATRCRLMTIHAAKGLEFPVVCVADLGAHAEPRRPAVRRRRRVGLRLRAAARRRGATTLDYEELRAERQRAASAEEEDRVFYVAMTRARERLLLSGAVDFAAWPRRAAPARRSAGSGRRSAAELPRAGRCGGGVRRSSAGGRAAPRCVTLSDPASYGTSAAPVLGAADAGGRRRARARGRRA